MGARANERAQRLSHEVTQLKTARVDLMKQMKELATANRYDSQAACTATVDGRGSDRQFLLPSPCDVQQGASGEGSSSGCPAQS